MWRSEVLVTADLSYEKKHSLVCCSQDSLPNVNHASHRRALGHKLLTCMKLEKLRKVPLKVLMFMFMVRRIVYKWRKPLLSQKTLCCRCEAVKRAPGCATKYPVDGWNQNWVIWNEHTTLCCWEKKGHSSLTATWNVVEGASWCGAALLSLDKFAITVKLKLRTHLYDQFMPKSTFSLSYLLCFDVCRRCSVNRKDI